MKDLSSVLGFNPASHVSPTSQALKDVLAELQVERSEEAKVAAKALLKEAIELHKKKTQLERDFKKAVEQIDKNLNKLVGRIQSGLDGTPQPVEADEPPVKTE